MYKPPSEWEAQILQAADSIPTRPPRFRSVQVLAEVKGQFGTQFNLMDVEGILAGMPLWVDHRNGDGTYGLTSDGFMVAHAVKSFYH